MLVYFHVMAMNHVMSVIKSEVDTLYSSGLYARADAIYVYLCFRKDQGKMRKLVRAFFGQQGTKFSIFTESAKPKIYERLTLQAIPAMVRDKDKVLYIHSKGVSHTDAEEAADRVLWVDLMLHWLVNRYQLCLDMLDKHDTVGVRYMTLPEPHYSGNFWWSTGKHLRALPLPIGDAYLDPEMWVCKGADVGEIKLPFEASHLVFPRRKEYVDLP